VEFAQLGEKIEGNPKNQKSAQAITQGDHQFAQQVAIEKAHSSDHFKRTHRNCQGGQILLTARVPALYSEPIWMGALGRLITPKGRFILLDQQ
jgi:hypothetical protein